VTYDISEEEKKEEEPELPPYLPAIQGTAKNAV